MANCAPLSLASLSDGGAAYTVCDTLEEAQASGVRKLADAAKRAARSAAKGVGRQWGKKS